MYSTTFTEVTERKTGTLRKNPLFHFVKDCQRQGSDPTIQTLPITNSTGERQALYIGLTESPTHTLWNDSHIFTKHHYTLDATFSHTTSSRSYGFTIAHYSAYYQSITDDTQRIVHVYLDENNKPQHILVQDRDLHTSEKITLELNDMIKQHILKNVVSAQQLQQLLQNNKDQKILELKQLLNTLEDELTQDAINIITKQKRNTYLETIHKYITLTHTLNTYHLHEKSHKAKWFQQRLRNLQTLDILPHTSESSDSETETDAVVFNTLPKSSTTFSFTQKVTVANYQENLITKLQEQQHHLQDLSWPADQKDILLRLEILKGYCLELELSGYVDNQKILAKCRATIQSYPSVVENFSKAVYEYNLAEASHWLPYAKPHLPQAFYIQFLNHLYKQTIPQAQETAILALCDLFYEHDANYSLCVRLFSQQFVGFRDKDSYWINSLIILAFEKNLALYQKLMQHGVNQSMPGILHSKMGGIPLLESLLALNADTDFIEPLLTQQHLCFLRNKNSIFNMHYLKKKDSLPFKDKQKFLESMATLFNNALFQSPITLAMVHQYPMIDIEKMIQQASLEILLISIGFLFNDPKIISRLFPCEQKTKGLILLANKELADHYTKKLIKIDGAHNFSITGFFANPNPSNNLFFTYFKLLSNAIKQQLPNHCEAYITNLMGKLSHLANYCLSIQLYDKSVLLYRSAAFIGCYQNHFTFEDYKSYINLFDKEAIALQHISLRNAAARYQTIITLFQSAPSDIQSQLAALPEIQGYLEKAKQFEKLLEDQHASLPVTAASGLIEQNFPNSNKARNKPRR